MELIDVELHGVPPLIGYCSSVRAIDSSMYVTSCPRILGRDSHRPVLYETYLAFNMLPLIIFL